MSDSIIESQNKKKGLGRGLGSLLGGSQPESTPTPNQTIRTAADYNQANSAQQAQMQRPQQQSVVAAAPVDPESKIWKVAIEKLMPGEFQPRRSFEKTTLQELAASIKESGILQPIVARRIASGKLEIVAGERRWRAAQIAGLTEVPVILKTFADKEALELAIVENIQREDLNPLDEAEAYQRLVEEFKMTQQQVADRVGKERATVANSLRILSLPVEVKEMIATKEITLGHAKVLLSVETQEQQKDLAKKIKDEKLSVRALEKLASKKPIQPATEKNAGVDTLIQDLEQKLQKTMGTKVTIDYSKGKGKLSVYFYSDDELNEITDQLLLGGNS